MRGNFIIPIYLYYEDNNTIVTNSKITICNNMKYISKTIMTNIMCVSCHYDYAKLQILNT